LATDLPFGGVGGNTFMNEQNITTTHEKRSFWLPLLGVGVLAAGGAAIYEGSQTSQLKHQFAASQQDNAALQAKLSDTDTELRKSISSLQNDLAQAREETNSNLQKAQGNATRQASVIVSRMAKKEEEQNRQLNEQLDQVKASSLEASNKLDGISNDVGTVKSDVGAVKTDVASAKSDIQDTRSELQRARGDMGQMSGLIATNSKEIQFLRDLGDRNIYEFTISRTDATKKVGDISVTLRKADTKHNKYTLDLLADDKKVEKKDRTVNEPVQFYTSKARQPYEIVVNQVQKDKIVGYLATPKVTVSRNEQGAQ
jgi:outer membrane murein-binding lipoprotein Lpp